jgi:TRAP-type C4-dicarboxylate transport system substrate-binding protein
MLTRRHVIASALAAPTILRFGIGTAHAATTLKISHQFPGGTIDKGDFRDRLCRMFAAEVTKRSGGEIAAEIYPNSSLIKTNAPRRQGHHPPDLGLAGRWRRQPFQADRGA